MEDGGVRGPMIGRVLGMLWSGGVDIDGGEEAE